MRPAAILFVLALALTLLPLLSLAAGCERDRSGPGLYRSYCRRCHGANGEGPKRPVELYPHLDLLTSPMVLRGDRATVRQRIAEGHGPMPGYARRLTPDEMERLIDFTLQLPRSNPGRKQHGPPATEGRLPEAAAPR